MPSFSRSRCDGPERLTTLRPPRLHVIPELDDLASAVNLARPGATDGKIASKGRPNGYPARAYGSWSTATAVARPDRPTAASRTAPAAHGRLGLDGPPADTRELPTTFDNRAGKPLDVAPAEPQNIAQGTNVIQQAPIK
jgi:hypothetical protein